MTKELELDNLFWKAISTNLAFQSWFLQRTKFAQQTLDLVTNEKWHQRWYRDPITNKDSETDILMIFTDPRSTNRYAIHVENKPSHGIWEPLQAENYRKRAIDRMSKWRYVDYQIALIAPLSIIKRSPREVEHFDIAIPYEDIGNFVPEFRHACTTMDLPAVAVEPTQQQLLELRALQALLHGLIHIRILEFKANPKLELPDLVSMVAGKQADLWFPIPGMAGGFQIRLIQDAKNEFIVFAESGSRIESGWMRHKLTLFNVRSEPCDDLIEPLFDEWVAGQVQC
jgi:hypothetical protein